MDPVVVAAIAAPTITGLFVLLSQRRLRGENSEQHDTVERTLGEVVGWTKQHDKRHDDLETRIGELNDRKDSVL